MFNWGHAINKQQLSKIGLIEVPSKYSTHAKIMCCLFRSDPITDIPFVQFFNYVSCLALRLFSSTSSQPARLVLGLIESRHTDLPSIAVTGINR